MQPTSASVKPTNNGTSWDGDGSGPDPYVSLACPATSTTFTNSTPEVPNNYSPTWSTGGCTMKARDLMQTGFVFQAFDSDISADDPITQAYSSKVVEASFVQNGFTMAAMDGLNSLTFSLQRR